MGVENIERNSSDNEDDTDDFDDDGEIMFVPEPNQDLDLQKRCKVHIRKVEQMSMNITIDFFGFIKEQQI